MNDQARVLKLRPANVVARLGQHSSLPILEPVRLERALSEKGVPLLCMPALLPGMMAGLLRAARELDALIGLSCPVLLERPHAAEAFISTLQREGEDLHSKPLFLQAGPLRLVSIDTAALDQAYTFLCKLVDAGFTLLSLDASRLGVANNVQVCRDLMQATAGKGVAVELMAPRSAGGRTSPEGLRNYLQSLERARVHPDFVRVGAPPLEAEQHPDGLDVVLLGELTTVASSLGVALTVADRGRVARGDLVQWARTGARKLDTGDMFSRIVLEVLPEEVRAGLLAQARETQTPMVELLGASESVLQSLEAGAQERLEAISFAEALALLSTLRAEGTATRATCWLVENGLH